MRILIALAEPFMPQQGGGSQTSALQLAAGFARRGSDVAIAAALNRRTGFGLMAAARMSVLRRDYDRATYVDREVFRAPAIAEQIESIVLDWRPDVVLVHGMSAMRLARTLTRLETPTVIYWRDVEMQKLNGSPLDVKARFLANSNFTAAQYKARFGITSTVVPPLIERDRYRAARRDKRTVAFVGSAPEKGLEIAVGVASGCPDIPFDVVESWILPRRRRAALAARLSRLPNVTFRPHRPDMRDIYGRARILLAPSQWKEAWGRVASEAHINGIPVVGSNIGGLVEAIGPGGVLVDPQAPVGEWIGHVRRLWDDRDYYQRLAASAEHYSHRQDLDQDWVLDRIMSELEHARNHPI